MPPGWEKYLSNNMFTLLERFSLPPQAGLLRQALLLTSPLTPALVVNRALSLLLAITASKVGIGPSRGRPGPFLASLGALVGLLGALLRSSDASWAEKIGYSKMLKNLNTYCSFGPQGSPTEAQDGPKLGQVGPQLSQVGLQVASGRDLKAMLPSSSHLNSSGCRHLAVLEPSWTAQGPQGPF